MGKLYRDFDTAHRREFLVTKDAFDVFEGNPNMDDFVEALYDETGRDTAVVYGVSGNVCVKYAVDGLRERDFGWWSSRMPSPICRVCPIRG